MAWASAGAAGSAGNATANSTVLTVTLNAQAGVGANRDDIIIYAISVQGASSVGGADEGAVLSVADSVGNSWVKVREVTAAAAGGTSTAGQVCSLWFARVDKALTTAGTVTATFGSSAARDGQAGIVYRFTNAPSAVRVADSTVLTVATSLSGTIDLTYPDASEQLRFRAIGARTTLTALTTTAGWTTIGTTRASATVPSAIFGEFQIVTATTAASAPRIATAVNQASVYAIFENCDLMGTVSL